MDLTEAARLMSKQWHRETKPCQVCGKKVQMLARQLYCSNACACKAAYQRRKK